MRRRLRGKWKRGPTRSRSAPPPRTSVRPSPSPGPRRASIALRGNLAGMIQVQPTVLEGRGLRLEPLSDAHHDALVAAASDGRLWELWYTAVAAPDGMRDYIASALKGQRDGHMMPWVVRDAASGAVIGSTRYHDIVPAIDRVEIGYTWYAESRQRTHVNTTCKLLLLAHAFETLGCKVVGLRTAIFHFRSHT